MRIQQTDRILKDARIARHATHPHEPEASVWSRMWKKLINLPSRLHR